MQQVTKNIVVMDLGSQTFRMAAAQCCGSEIRISGSWLRNVRLGQGLAESDMIGPDAMDRGIRVLKEFMQTIRTMVGGRSSVHLSIKAVGTAALRDATNAQEFIDAAAGIGIHIDVITGMQEAETAAHGVLYTLRHQAPIPYTNTKWMGTGTVSIVDVGGGSTEISVCDQQGIRQWNSIGIGAVRLTEEFALYSGRPAGTDCRTIMDMACRIDEVLTTSLPESASTNSCSCLAGSGGTVTTAAAMELAMPGYDPKRIRGLMLSIQSIERWINRLARMTNSEKGSISGLEPERSDIILAGMVIIHRIMEKLRFPAIIISDGGLLLGLLIREIEKECTSHAELSCPGGLYI